MDLETFWCDWDEHVANAHKENCTDKYKSNDTLLQNEEGAAAREKKLSRIERHTSEIADFECDWGKFPEVKKSWGRRIKHNEQTLDNFELLAVKMAIVDKEYPDVLIKQEMVWPLHSAIFSMIFTTCSPDIKIGISNVIDGALRVNCFGTKAVEWLKWLEGITIEGVTLKVLEANDLQKLCKLNFGIECPSDRIIKMAIVSDKHPAVPIEERMVPTIQAIVNEMLDTTNTTKPIINITQVVGGALHVDCGGINSVERLAELNGKSVEEGITLKVVNTKNLPKPVKMIWSTKMHSTDTLKMLKYLQRWNKKLRTCDWKIVYTYISRPYLRRIILMDVVSANVIKVANYNLYAGVEFTRFRLCESKDSPATGSDLEVVEGDSTVDTPLVTPLLKDSLATGSDLEVVEGDSTFNTALVTPLVKDSLASGSDLEVVEEDSTFNTAFVSPLVSEEQALKSSSKYKKLSGAGRKRLWKLVKDGGVDLQQALLLARKPWKETLLANPELKPNLKRGRSEEESSKEKPKDAPEMYATPEACTNPSPSYRDIGGTATVRICNAEPMTEIQMSLVHASINKTICLMGKFVDNKGSGPKFLGFSHKPGWILVTCENQESKEWLVQEISKCMPWPEAQLSVMQETELPKTWTATTLIPYLEAETVSAALDMIRYQNEGLNTENWRVLKEEPEKTGTVAVFNIDEASAETLYFNNYQVHLGFRKLTFRVKFPYQTY